MVAILGTPDQAVEHVASALGEFEKAHPQSECMVYRYNPASIRVRIVDAAFAGMSRGERHDYAKAYFDKLPEDAASQISILLCLEPGEKSILDLEFREPSRSQL